MEIRRLITGRGVVVDTWMTDDEAAHRLAQMDIMFGNTLLRKKRQYGSLSADQWAWVHKLVVDELHPPQPQVAEIGSMAGVIALFERAKQALKYPKIHLRVPATGQDVCLSVAGSGSKYPGTVIVTDGGRFGANKFFGRISTDGRFSESLSARAAGLEDLLREFASRPAEVASAHGKLTGQCAFCNTKLSDPRSTAIGIGPVCAKNYGLLDQWKHADSLLNRAAAEFAPDFELELQEVG